MSGANTFGRSFCVTTFGESHGPAIGCVIDGCPPGIAIDAEDFRHDLERRATGRSRFTSQRRETDAVEILSGLVEGDQVVISSIDEFRGAERVLIAR